jgi:archaeosine-15-forming tRNA-guanine transglycosylase
VVAAVDPEETAVVAADSDLLAEGEMIANDQSLRKK